MVKLVKLSPLLPLRCTWIGPDRKTTKLAFFSLSLLNQAEDIEFDPKLYGSCADDVKRHCAHVHKDGPAAVRLCQVYNFFKNSHVNNTELRGNCFNYIDRKIYFFSDCCNNNNENFETTCFSYRFWNV